jgi:hypothetical protein
MLKQEIATRDKGDKAFMERAQNAKERQTETDEMEGVGRGRTDGRTGGRENAAQWRPKGSTIDPLSAGPGRAGDPFGGQPPPKLSAAQEKMLRYFYLSSRSRSRSRSVARSLARSRSLSPLSLVSLFFSRSLSWNPAEALGRAREDAAVSLSHLSR